MRIEVVRMMQLSWFGEYIVPVSAGDLDLFNTKKNNLSVKLNIRNLFWLLQFTSLNELNFPFGEKVEMKNAIAWTKFSVQLGGLLLGKVTCAS